MSNTLTTPQGVVAIRPAVPDDAAALRELRLEALGAHPDAFSADYAAAAAQSAQAWAERVAGYAVESQGVICVAAAAGRLVGMTGLVREQWPKSRHGATLWGVYVKVEWRGLHVAEALVNEGIAWARAHGVVILKLGVVTRNVAAIRCYARCGFTVYGLDPKTIRHDGVYYDELLMAREV